MLRRFATPLVVICATLVHAVGLPAAEHPADAIPENAGVVVRLAQPRQTVQKATNFVGQVKRAYAPFVQLGALQMGKVISNPTSRGVDQTRDWWIAVFPHAEPNRQPSMLFLVPVNDVQAARNAVRGNFQFIEHEDWLLYTDDQEVADAVQARIDAGKTVPGGVDQRAKDLIAQADLAAYVNLVQLKKTYAAQLEEGRKQVAEKIEEAQNFAPDVEGLNMGGIFNMYTQMFQGVFQVLEDADAFVVGMNIDTDAITFDELLIVKADSPTSQSIAKHAPSRLSGVSRLQDEQLVYFGLKCDMDSLISWGTEIWTQMLGDEELVKQLEPKIAELREFEFGSYYGSFSIVSDEGPQGVLRSTVVADVQPVDKMRELSREMTAMMSKMEVAGMKQEYSLEKGAETINGQSVDIMSVKQEVNPELDPLGLQRMLMNTMYGPDGMTSRVIYTDTGMVQVIGGDQTYAKTVLDALADSTPRDALGRTREQLLEEANVFGAIDLPRFAVEILRVVISSNRMPVQIPVTEQMLDSLELSPSYCGITITTEKDGIRCRSTIPSAQVAGIVKIFEMFQGRAAEQPQF